MNTTTLEGSNKSSTKSQPKSWLALLIAALFLGPLLIATTWYFIATNKTAQSTVNHGRLLLSNKPLVWPEFFAPPQGKWLLLHFVETGCNQVCEQLLQRSREVQGALAHDAGRVERVIVTPSSSSCQDSKWCAAGDVNLTVVTLPPENYFTILDQVENVAGTINGSMTVVDPFGNLVLNHSTAIDRNDVLVDIKRLLKLSRIG
ncbi:MAG: hypothetical protein HKM24_03465 [Gammaproteobacteria bacterium]|nr:hypothetical protein [Gammaproteobacteria bacterium]